MEYIKNSKSYLSFIVIGSVTGIFVALLPITSLSQMGLMIGLLVGFVIFLYLGYRYDLKLLLFLLFLTFGWMNLPLKPFDLLFVMMLPLLFIRKVNKLQYLQNLRLINYCLLAFSLVSLLSIVSSTDSSQGISFFIHTMYMLVIFYCMAIFIRTEKEIKVVIWGYIVSALISAVAVMAEFSGFVTNVGTLFMGIRAQGFFIDPNDFAPFLTLAIVILLNKAFSNSCFSGKYYLFVSLVFLLLFALLASMSRAAILNAAITLFIYLLCSVVYRKLFAQTILLLSLVSVVLLFTLILFGDTIQNSLFLRFSHSTGTVLQSYDTERFYFQLKGLQLGSTHLLGIGPGQFELLYGYATHNLFVRIIAENGWISFIFFFILLIYVLGQLFSKRKQVVWNLPIYLFLAVYMGILINSMFLDTLHWRYLWFFLGLCCAVLQKAGKSKI